MKIMIVGCGKIGKTIIESLSAEGHDVTAVDASAEALEEVKNVYDVITVCGNGADPDTLKVANAKAAHLVVAATDSDETNMLCCFFARRMGAAHTIARVRNTDYDEKSIDFMRRELNISMTINPERLAAKELFNILKLPSAAKIESFSSRRFEMIELRLKEGSPLEGVRLSDLRNKYAQRFLVCAVQRGEEVFIPDGNFVLKAGDKIGLTAAPAEITKLFRELKILQKQAKRIFIFGGSRTTYYLAKRLLAAGSKVKIIEQHHDRCEELCDLLPAADVSEGDGAQQEILEEEGVRSADAFVALTGIDEENILIAFIAASMGVPKVIVKVNRDELGAIAEKMGLESIISPRKLIADVLVQYARALQNSMGSAVETLYKLMDSNVEALEFKVAADFSGTDVPLKDMKLRKNILIAGIIRGRDIIIPSGADTIRHGDRVVVISAAGKLNDLSDILKQQKGLLS